jgi:glycosyltransferase involved in cell wall biosynthesis
MAFILEKKLVSVLLPVFNASKFLHKAIESILCQTYTNIELIIINDGSTDNSIEIIKSFNDNRIKLINNSTNLGLIKTLNLGLVNCKGQYIARMDADDISLKNRIECQVEYLQKNKNINICGTGFILLDEQDNFIKNIIHPTKHNDIKFGMIYHSVINHPSVMFNRNVYDENKENFYNSSFKHIEDYELWTRLVKKYNFSNLKQIHFCYRLHNNQVSSLNQLLQDEKTNLIRFKYIITLFPTLKDENINMVLSFFNRDFLINGFGFKKLLYFVKQIFISNLINKEFKFYYLSFELIRICSKNISKCFH